MLFLVSSILFYNDILTLGFSKHIKQTIHIWRGIKKIQYDGLNRFMTKKDEVCAYFFNKK